MVIDLGASGLTLTTGAYRLILFGSGSPVIANTQGIALDGENLSNGDDPNTGTDFRCLWATAIRVVISTTRSSSTPHRRASPRLVRADPTSDSNIVGDNITNVIQPSFIGSITETYSSLVPVADKPSRSMSGSTSTGRRTTPPPRLPTPACQQSRSVPRSERRHGPHHRDGCLHGNRWR